jgi:hypothetical protein
MASRNIAEQVTWANGHVSIVICGKSFCSETCPHSRLRNSLLDRHGTRGHILLSMTHEDFNTIIDSIKKLPTRVHLKLGRTGRIYDFGQYGHGTAQRTIGLGLNVESGPLYRSGFRKPITGHHLAASLRHLQLQNLQLAFRLSAPFCFQAKQPSMLLHSG